MQCLRQLGVEANGAIILKSCTLACTQSTVELANTLQLLH